MWAKFTSAAIAFLLGIIGVLAVMFKREQSAKERIVQQTADQARELQARARVEANKGQQREQAIRDNIKRHPGQRIDLE